MLNTAIKDSNTLRYINHKVSTFVPSFLPFSPLLFLRGNKKKRKDNNIVVQKVNLCDSSLGTKMKPKIFSIPITFNNPIKPVFQILNELFKFKQARHKLKTSYFY